MLKRVLTLLLALTLSLGLLPCAALADAPRDTDPPQWSGWGYESLAEMLKAWGWTEADYYDFIAWSVAKEQEYPAWKKAYLSAHPGCQSQLLAEDAKNPAWKQMGYENAEAFEKASGESYKDYLTDNFLMDQFRREWQAAYQMRKRVELGGPAEGVAVMWQGKFVSFPDAVPAIVNDRTMIPVRALMEQTGAKVDYQDGVVVLTTADTEIRFRAGDTGIAVRRGSETETVQMDVAPYVSQDRTYVPLRFFSQTLGYDVLWDSDYKTAVILDRERIIADLDKEFKVLNSYLTAQSKTVGDSQKLSGSVSGKLTVFDTISGNKTANLTGSIAALAKDGDMDAKYSINVKELVSLLLKTPGLKDALESSGEELAKSLSALTTLDMEMIRSGDRAYLKTPLLSVLTDGKIAANTWLSMDLEDLGLRLSTRQEDAGSVGAQLYYFAVSEEDGVHAYEKLTEAGSNAAKWLGDKCFTSVGGGKELTIDPKALPADAQEELDEAMERLSVESLSLKLRVNNDGSARLTAEAAMEGLLGGKISMELNAAAARSTMKLSLHLRNVLELTVSADATAKETKDSPRKAPPAGAPLVDMRDHLDAVA